MASVNKRPWSSLALDSGRTYGSWMTLIKENKQQATRTGTKGRGGGREGDKCCGIDRHDQCHIILTSLLIVNTGLNLTDKRTEAASEGTVEGRLERSTTSQFHPFKTQIQSPVLTLIETCRVVSLSPPGRLFHLWLPWSCQRWLGWSRPQISKSYGSYCCCCCCCWITPGGNIVLFVSFVSQHAVVVVASFVTAVAVVAVAV